LPVDIAQILDLLMIVVLAMFIPIGLWRGALREWIALVGITLGSLLAAEWAQAWGGDVGALFGVAAPLGAFIVGALLFLGSTLLIGYGGGAALPYRPDLTRANRLLGALLAVGNGALILSGTLRLMQRHLFNQEPDSLLLGTTLSRFLIDEVGWAQLVLLGTLLLCVTISLLRRWVGGPPLMEEFAPAIVVARAEPGEEPEELWEAVEADDHWGASGQPAAAAAPAARQETAILHIFPTQANAARPAPVAPPVPPTPNPPPAPVPAAQPPARATALVSVPKVVDIARPTTRVAPAPPMIPPGTVIPAAPAQANGHTMGAADHASESDDDRTTIPTGFAAGLACPVCGQIVAARSRFCHHCGHIIGEAERRRVARHD
jgi:hypothetical protein